jgi:hypothetical protein
MDREITEAAIRLKAYFLQHRKGQYENSKDTYLLARACAMGTCGSAVDGPDVDEKLKKKIIDSRNDALLRTMREVDHDTIVIFRLQQLIENQGELPIKIYEAKSVDKLKKELEKE